jgi:toxin ParE1/3/4
MTDMVDIRYLSTAERDLKEIFLYIMKDRPTAAPLLLDEIDSSISVLAYNPEMGIVPKDDRLKMLGYRILIIKKYLVFYVIKSDHIQIRRVLHGARQYSFLL